MALGLTAKQALATGATGGIGSAAVRALAREGARVIVNERTQGHIDAAVQPSRATVRVDGGAVRDGLTP